MPITNPPSPIGYHAQIHTLQVMAKTMNPEIKAFFDPLDKLPDNDISTPTGALMHACFIRPEDPVALNHMRMDYYSQICGGLIARIGDEFYGIPKSDFKQKKNRLAAQVVLKFQEPKTLQKRRKAKNPKRMTVSCDLLKPATEVTEEEIRAIASRLYREFPKPTKRGDMHFCGRSKYTYMAYEDGLQITQLQASSTKEAEQFIQKICRCMGREYREGLLKESKHVKPVQDQEVTVLDETTVIKKSFVLGYVELRTGFFIGSSTGVDKALFFRPDSQVAP